MNKQFNVLDRTLDIHQNYLLEASAGTGKTFSIQNLVVRLLMEDDSTSIDKILVVTFTRAATRELKMRIRITLEKAIQSLEEGIISNDTPDYLIECLQRGEAAVKIAKKRLQHALFTFDQAQVFTIHAFCARMLRQFSMESDMGMHVSLSDEPLAREEILSVVSDFFRTGIRPELYSPVQLEIYLKKDPEQKKLLKFIQKGFDFQPIPSFDQIYLQFNALMGSLKNDLSLISERMIDDFKTQAGSYNNFGKETKARTLEKIISFAKLFEKDHWTREDLDRLILDGMVWTKALDPALLKKGEALQEKLNYPGLTMRLASFSHLIEVGGSFSHILLRMAHDCRHHLKRFQKEEEKLSPDDLLRKMADAISMPSFLSKVQNQYLAAIIDEFQDTDPVQWEIFKQLFLPDDISWKGYLYLVGDPKQSIYSFRQADIYTYLAAAKAIGEDHCFSLNINYRSQARLIDGLNTLFDLPNFIPLPRTLKSLSYHPVQAAKEGVEYLSDECAAVHFFIADSKAYKKAKLELLETDIFFPFIAQEINRLMTKKGFSFNQFAILVRDRHQAFELCKFFSSIGVPFLNQKGLTLSDSPALQALIDFIRALIHPHDRGLMRVALGSPLMGWDYAEIKKLEGYEFFILLMRQLKITLMEKGFATFFQELLHSEIEGRTILEQILSREGGLEFYQDLQQIADIVSEHQFIEWSNLQGIIPFLDNFQNWERNEDKRVARFQDSSKDGVNVLTLHFSKGLEFDVVFALGLVKRNSLEEELIPIESDGKFILTPTYEDKEAFLRYCEECDSEKMRQLYVALTRAKDQLYVPAILDFPSNKLEFGEASPIELFIARLQKPLSSYQALYEQICQKGSQPLISFIEEVRKNHSISYSLHREPFTISRFAQDVAEPIQLIPPPVVSVPGKPFWMTSFTALNHQLERADRNAMKFPSDYGAYVKDVHSLPANSETGLLIHQILEKISFRDFERLNVNQAIPLITPFVQNTSLKGWEATITTLIYNALNTPLTNKFSLSSLNKGQFYREMPFVFSHKKDGVIEEITFNEGLIKGVIDLIFIHENQYYLVDWKTNWLGPQTKDYEKGSMQLAMEENSYFLQAKIYAQALKLYLKLVDPRPFEECFGGIYYLFLRGISPENDSGIFYFSGEKPIKPNDLAF